jgi:hypothetical protein
VQRAGTARRALRGALLGAAIFALLAIGFSRASAQEVSKQQMQGLDEQVQEIKSEVLGIAAELGRLEEKLLYPSGTQVSVFVSLAGGEGFRLDSLQIQLDGQPVARHVYRFEELEALRKGGVQRIYTGNVGAGEHRLEVSLAGKRGGEEVASRESFSFRKDVEPKLIGITLDGGGSGAPSIRLGDR